MIIETEIRGIPCKARVTHYRPAVAPIVTGPMDWADPGAAAEIEFEILDAACRPDPRLEAQMDSADVAAVEQEIIAAHESAAAEAKAEARIEALEFREWGAQA